MNARTAALVVLSFALPAAALAVGNDAALNQFMTKLVRNVIQPIILLLFALAMFFFVNGIIVYILKAAEPKERAKGAQHMLWGVIGLFIMSSAILILQLLVNSLNAGITLPNL